MLIEFSGEHSGSVMMFGKVATQLLKMMGQSGNDKGAISAPDVPDALGALKDALQQMPDPAADKSDNDQDSDQDENEVSIHTRAVPLIDLLEDSVSNGGYVMWQPK